ncbi:adenosine deaminase [Polyangium sp. 6x1]|uniref:adenosine deaminase n=1 Tax=Polyangium sp. 6x1 TaxID=3042689 RepID=UPI002482C359|nr:adenosine deaminase [Polyangium sp. 6x1]MDI1443816.1 adenosine deaminase [Polyangium sp. 6x1]
METDTATGGVGTLPLEFFQQLPKTDLHVHLDGSLRLETIIDLAKKHGIEMPSYDPAELRRAMRLGQNTGSLVEYLKAFDVTLRVLQTEDALFRVAYELAEDAARENVRYMEVRYAPMLHTRLGLKLTSVVEAVLAGLRAAHDNLGIESAVIVCGIRNISPHSSLEMAELAVAYKNRGVVGFDLAGAEYDNPAKHHKAAFQLVRDNNINCTIHAGEAYGPESIAQAIHVCGAHRIGHGCRLRENGDLLHYVNDHRIPLEACPSSNVQTGAVRDLASHPLKLYYNLGLRVTVNTDNRLVTDTTVSNELWLCHTKMGMSLRDIKTILVSGFKSAFMPFHIKQSYLRRVTEELERFQPDGRILPARKPDSSRHEQETWLPRGVVPPVSFDVTKPATDVSPVHAAVERAIEDGAN